MKTTIVYHQAKPGTDCPDGICAAWVVARAIGGDIELIGDSYLNNSEYDRPEYKLPFDFAGKQIILVDFSYPKSILERIAANSKSLTILDHHVSRADDISALSDRILGGYNGAECGATFAWCFFHPEKPEPWFLRHVWRRDTGADGYYDGECPESEAISEAMSSRRRQYGIGEAAFPFFDELCRVSETELVAVGMPKISERNEAIQSYLSEWELAPKMIDVLGDRVPLFECPQYLHRNYSMVGSMATRRHQDYPFVAVIAGDPTKISLRSHSQGADVSVIARRLGGGGHRHAAGYSL